MKNLKEHRIEKNFYQRGEKYLSGRGTTEWPDDLYACLEYAKREAKDLGFRCKSLRADKSYCLFEIDKEEFPTSDFNMSGRDLDAAQKSFDARFKNPTICSPWSVPPRDLTDENELAVCNAIIAGAKAAKATDDKFKARANNNDYNRSLSSNKKYFVNSPYRFTITLERSKETNEKCYVMTLEADIRVAWEGTTFEEFQADWDDMLVNELAPRMYPF